MKALEIGIWSDIACPWCWVGKRHLEAAVAEAGLPVDRRWRAFELDPGAPREAPESVDYAQRLADVARYVAISPYHLVRLFRSEVGLRPYDYLIQQRVQRAQELLAGGWTITAVAHEVGFADQSHLHRHFKRRLGVTPGVFRQGHLGVPCPVHDHALSPGAPAS